jgi:catechol 2,3-dioxygenase-like lactoylglutathione lyase family enzyme
MAGKNKKIIGGGFHHVSLKVSDLNRSIKFYTEGLGFVEKISWGEERWTGDRAYFTSARRDGARSQSRWWTSLATTR